MPLVAYTAVPVNAPTVAPAAAVIPASGLQAWHCFAFLIVAAVVWSLTIAYLTVADVSDGETPPRAENTP